MYVFDVVANAIANINPEFLEDMSQMKVGGMTNGKRNTAAETNKKV